MSKRIDWWEVLDLFVWGFGKLACPTFNTMLAGLDEDRYRTVGPQLYRRLVSEEWVTKSGRGSKAEFTITAKGKNACAEVDPAEYWDRPWDRRWRLVTFDVPERRRTDRVTLWRELRLRRLGLLQRSVWISAHEIEGTLKEIIQANGIPECFAGFECTRLFLCSNEEVVKTAWDFREINLAHERYLKKIEGILNAIRRASSLTALARCAREERMAYADALEDDPLLPRELWLDGYCGPDISGGHKKARTELAASFQRLMDKS